MVRSIPNQDHFCVKCLQLHNNIRIEYMYFCF